MAKHKLAGLKARLGVEVRAAPGPSAPLPPTLCGLEGGQGQPYRFHNLWGDPPEVVPCGGEAVPQYDSPFLVPQAQRRTGPAPNVALAVGVETLGPSRKCYRKEPDCRLTVHTHSSWLSIDHHIPNVFIF